MSLFKFLQCKEHGEYRSFISDPTPTCPYCNKNNAEIEAQEKTPQKFQMNIVEVTISCAVHGEITRKVPELIASSIKCDRCSNEIESLNIAKSKERRISEEFHIANIPVNSRNIGLNQLDYSKCEKQIKIATRLKDYVNDLVAVDHAIGAKNILLSGQMGTGKTLFISIALQNLIKRSVICKTLSANDIEYRNKLKCLFITESQIVNDIKETWRNGCQFTVKELYQKLSSVPVLCIDDVGTNSLSDHLFDAYTVIIDERYKRKLPTLMTSNFEHTEIHNVIGARAADRFFEKNRIVVMNCDWTGYRVPNADEIEII